MKNTYETPVLQVLGSVESLTEAFGSALVTDTITYAGHAPQPSTGSRNGVVNPTTS